MTLSLRADALMGKVRKMVKRQHIAHMLLDCLAEMAKIPNELSQEAAPAKADLMKLREELKQKDPKPDVSDIIERLGTLLAVFQKLQAAHRDCRPLSEAALRCLCALAMVDMLQRAEDDGSGFELENVNYG